MLAPFATAEAAELLSRLGRLRDLHLICVCMLLHCHLLQAARIAVQAWQSSGRRGCVIAGACLLPWPEGAPAPPAPSTRGDSCGSDSVLVALTVVAVGHTT